MKVEQLLLQPLQKGNKRMKTISIGALLFVQIVAIAMFGDISAGKWGKHTNIEVLLFAMITGISIIIGTIAMREKK